MAGNRKTRDGAEMVWIPGGSFSMGCSAAKISEFLKFHTKYHPDSFVDETPEHTVRVDSFWMYQYDVTVALYRQFCEAARRNMPQAPEWGWHDDHPIVNVSWEDARAYADWAGVALPTEAEWEYAARGGTQATFLWGDAWPPPNGVGNFADETCKQSGQYIEWAYIKEYDDGYVNTSPVGAFTANAYGLYDMVGNVWQWCADWYDAEYYAHSPADNPTGPANGSARVLRGGSWFSCGPRPQRVTVRRVDDPSSRSDGFGFRCVLRSPEP